MFLSKKENGRYSLLIDYRVLNKITIKNHVSLPSIKEQFDTFHVKMLLTKPRTFLLKKNEKFLWTGKQEKAFNS